MNPAEKQAPPPLLQSGSPRELQASIGLSSRIVAIGRAGQSGANAEPRERRLRGILSQMQKHKGLLCALSVSSTAGTTDTHRSSSIQRRARKVECRKLWVQETVGELHGACTVDQPALRSLSLRKSASVPAEGMRTKATQEHESRSTNQARSGYV